MTSEPQNDQLSHLQERRAALGGQLLPRRLRDVQGPRRLLSPVLVPTALVLAVHPTSAETASHTACTEGRSIWDDSAPGAGRFSTSFRTAASSFLFRSSRASTGSSTLTAAPGASSSGVSAIFTKSASSSRVCLLVPVPASLPLALSAFF